MGSKGSQTTSTTSSTAPNPTAMAAYNDILGRAQGVAATPYTPYNGELVAGVNPQQSAGIANINSNWNYAQPYLQTAAGYAQDAATPLTQAQIQQYMSPYTQDVVNATQAQFNNQNEQQRQGVVGNAISQGALGGNREAIAEAELANQQQTAQAPVISGLYNQAYSSGLNTALTEQQARAQGAYSLGNLGVSGQNAALTGANAQVGAGTLQQGSQQALDAAQYQQFVNQQAYPFQTAQWLAGIGTGVGSQMGGTSAGTSTAPAPSLTSQLLGGATAGIGALGGTGAFGAAGWLTALMANGGAVNGRARGGVAPDGPGTMPETPETLKLQQRQLLAGHRRVQMFPRGTPELPLPRGMNRIEHENGTFHYDPRRIDGSEIRRLSSAGRENDMLDLGPYSKDDVLKRLHGGEVPVAVVERHPDGTEARAAIGTHTTAARQMAAMNRAKSPGHTVRLEDPRETIAHRMRGGGVQRFADGGAPGLSGMPYADSHGWVPTIGITGGHGAPDAPHQPNAAANQNPGLNKDSFAGLGDAVKSINSFRQGNSGLATDTPDNGSGIYTGDASMPGFPSSEGFADGGAPSAPTNGVGAMMFGQPHSGGRGWVPKHEIARRAAPPAGVAPPPAMSALADQAKEIGSLANMIYNPKSGDAAPAPAAEAPPEGDGPPPMYRGGTVRLASGGVANLPFHFPVPHLADGGSPYDTSYFDDTFGSPIWHDADSYNTASHPDQMQAYSDRARTNVLAENAAGMPLPRPRPAGIAPSSPSYDMPPEIMTGQSRPQEQQQTALGYADDAAPRRAAPRSGVQVVRGDQPSPLDDAAWPQGPVGSPGGAGHDAMAQEPPAPRGVAPGMNFGAESKLWPSLMAAGLGMMASKSPFAGVAIGEGGLTGMQTYASERQREDKINSEVKKLAQEAEFAQKRLDLATRPFTEQTADQKARTAETREYHQILGSRMQLRPTGSMVDVGDGTQHPVFIDSRTGQSIDGVTGDPIAPDAKIVTGGGKPGATQVLARELMRDRDEQRKTDPNLPPLSLEDAVNLAHRAPNGDQATVRRLNMAQGAWKAWTGNPINMGKKDAPESSLEFWEKRYGVTGTPQAGGAPGAPAPTPAPAAAKALQPMDQQALDWANANPNDPRAAAIKKRLGVQ